MIESRAAAEAAVSAVDAAAARRRGERAAGERATILYDRGSSRLRRGVLYPGNGIEFALGARPPSDRRNDDWSDDGAGHARIHAPAGIVD